MMRLEQYDIVIFDEVEFVDSLIKKFGDLLVNQKFCLIIVEFCIGGKLVLVLCVVEDMFLFYGVGYVIFIDEVKVKILCV